MSRGGKAPGAGRGAEYDKHLDLPASRIQTARRGTEEFAFKVGGDSGFVVLVKARCVVALSFRVRVARRPTSPV